MVFDVVSSQFKGGLNLKKGYDGVVDSSAEDEGAPLLTS